MPQSTMFDDVANDLALWIDETATKVALAMAPRVSPFAVQLTEAQKLDIYTRALFNPDGSPNTAGRQQQLERLGPEGFANVYKAVVRAHTELKPRMAEPDSIDALAPAPPAPPPPPPAPPPMPMPMPGLPPGPIPRMPGPPPGLAGPMPQLPPMPAVQTPGPPMRG